MLHGTSADPPRALEVAVLVRASTVATVTRYAALRTWVVTPARRPRYGTTAEEAALRPVGR